METNNKMYYKIISEGLKYSIENGMANNAIATFLVGHFIREAQKAKDLHFEYSEFFEGLKATTGKIRKSLENQSFVFKKVDEIRIKIINDSQHLKTCFGDLDFMQSLYRNSKGGEDCYEPDYNWVRDVLENPDKEIVWAMHNIERDRQDLEWIESAISAAENEMVNPKLRNPIGFTNK